MTNVLIKRLRDDCRLPEMATKGSAAFDLYLPDDVVLGWQPQIIPLGFAIQIPQAYVGQILPRSSSVMKGIAVHAGTIDSDYRGEVGLIAWALPQAEAFASSNGVIGGTSRMVQREIVLHQGERIAQLSIVSLAWLPVKFTEVGKLDETKRGKGGFGSTGE